MLAVAVDVLVFLLFGAFTEHVCRGFIERRCAEAAAERQHKRAIVEIQRLAGGFALGLQNGNAHRVASEDAVIFAVEVLFRVLHGEHDALRVLCKRFSRHAGIGVLLVDDGGNAELLCGANDGAADVTAGADANIRLKRLDDALGLDRRGEQAEHGFDVAADVLRR